MDVCLADYEPLRRHHGLRFWRRVAIADRKIGAAFVLTLESAVRNLELPGGAPNFVEDREIVPAPGVKRDIVVAAPENESSVDKRGLHEKAAGARAEAEQR